MGPAAGVRPSPRWFAGKVMAATQHHALSLPARPDGLVWRFDGRRLLGHRVATMGPVEVSWANFADVAAVADLAGVQYFCVPVSAAQRLRIGIRGCDWARFVRELNSAQGRGGRQVGQVIGERLRLSRRPGSAGDLNRARVLRVFTPVSPPGSSVSLGQRFGVDVERWDEGPGNSLDAPRANLAGPLVPPELSAPVVISERGRKVPSLAAFDVVPADRVTFDIDVVYTWVDGDDPAWIARRAAAAGAADARQLIEPADRDARFRQRDELRYSLRSLRMYAPWVRHIWIVTDDQAPDWLVTEADGVTLVSHREIWAAPVGDGAVHGLPTFNSHAIEARLHHIDGLAEHFIYMNDDFLLGRPLDPESFFYSNGIIATSLSTSHIPPGPARPGDTTPTVAGKNIRRLIARDFGRTIRHRLRHTPYPMRRSIMFELEERYPEQFAHLLTSQFRNSDDVAPISLCHHYAYLTGRAVPGDVLCRYVELERETLPANIRRIETKQSDWDTLCLNDTEVDPADAAWVNEQLGLFLERRFPIPSDLESQP